MCSVNGVFAFSGELKKDEIELGKSMHSFLRHRGPDERGVFLDSVCMLASNRFSITGVPDGKMPISSEDGRIVVVLNGEIYNYASLREELAQKGHSFKTSGDTEVIVHLYEEEGEDSFKKLKGMFAFALYDSSSPKHPRLFVVRDRFGEKPLFYVEKAGTLFFASESSALLSATDKKISLDGLAQYLSFGFSFNHIVEGIMRLRSGEYLCAVGSGLEVKRYWRPKFNTNYRVSFDDAVAKTEELFKEAVLLMTPKEVNYGLFLSGGIDSSAVGTQMRNFTGTVDAYTSGLVGVGDEISLSELDSDFSRVEKDGNEFEFTDAFAQGTKGVILNKRKFSVEELISLLSEMVAHLPGGPVGSTSFPLWFFSGEKASSDGVRVALAGEGADELFGGYSTINPALYSENDVAGGFSKIMGWFGIKETRELLKFGFNDPFESAQKYVDSNFEGTGQQEDLFFNKLRFVVGPGLVIAPHMLEKADGMTMTYPVEIRMPFLYPDLVEFLYTLPSGYFVSNKGTKLLLRSVAERMGVLKEIIKRPKQRTSLPYTKLFYKSGPHSKKLLELISSKDSLINKYLNREKVLEVISGSEKNPRRVWLLLVLELYLQLLEGKSA